MRLLLSLAPLAAALGIAAAQQVAPPKTTLKVGDPAPEVVLRTTQGTTFKLSDHRGKTVVLAFFPAAFTGG